MLLRNKGFFLIELLLSLSLMLMLSLFFIPLIINMKSQMVKLEIEKQSYQLLYEELQLLLINGKASPARSLSMNGIEYQISWKYSAISEEMEVCIKVENNTVYGEKELCQISE
jgi:competence protein ComGE